ncbi:hypothetical protein V496_02292 [Pseudogymnoascus sp. VKM F-4515 (FW-2607)]|nr:hypothetical protein V496_02292 [Pseudogymnoascus sp. VKM F-4515 (FW-2607)]KFY79269.1 hypothetical protein V498_08964 [Pseudogymnoascus sp. VKM F-4517 (FW-2822)]
MQQRRDEILAKKAKLEELKRQRALRAREVSATRQSIGSPIDLISPTPGRSDNRRELDNLISSLVGDSRPGSTGPGGAGSPAHRGSRPNSVLSAGALSNENSDIVSPADGPAAPQSQSHTISTQTLSTVSLSTVYECPPSPVKEVFSYSKGVQTSGDWAARPDQARPFAESDNEDGPLPSTPNTKRLSRRDRDREEELRQNLRKEIEDELKAARDSISDGPLKPASQSGAGANFPLRALTDEELAAIKESDDLQDFLERSCKVIERALDQEYDVLADYAHNNSLGMDDEDDVNDNVAGKGRRKVKQIAQFYDERWSKKRMISSINFSPKFPELVLASYTKNPSAPHDPDGLVQVWNTHLHDRPEFVFHAQSDVLTAKFSPFHPNLIIGGAYSGQVLLWDTRAKSAPVQKTPLTGSGHTHPVYSVDIVGTQNANNILSCSTDGVVCGWSVDMFTQPQELLTLTTPPPAKTEDLSPTCMAFPQTDPTYFLVGSEEGTIYPCHRYDRAGSKAGVDQRVSYRGHAAPVMSLSFHPARGPIDLGDLVLSSSLDWSVKLWRMRAPATATTGITGEAQVVAPLLDIVREDVVYDAAWSPSKPGVFSLVDGAGFVEVWDLNVDTEVPCARLQTKPRLGARSQFSRSLNRVAWEETEGKRLATGGIDGELTVFEVGPDLGGKESSRSEEWTSMKKLVAKLEAAGLGGQGMGMGGALFNTPNTLIIKMLFMQILVLGSAFAVANAKVIITNSDYSGITFDQPFTVTWQGATGMVSLLLKNGVPSNQLLVDTIADGLSGNSFTWYPEGDLEEGIYNLEIKDSSGGVNYSPQFRIDHGIDYDHGEGDNDQHHSVAPGHFLNNATDTIATATTAATATTEHAGPASTLVPVHNATVTSSVALNNTTGGTPTNTSVSPPTSSVLTAQAAHHVSPLNGLLFSLLGALALGIAN